MYDEMFVGRKKEIGELHEAWRRLCAANGGPKLLILSGERGVGKTSIALEFYRQLAAKDTGNSYWPHKISGVNPSFESHSVTSDTSIPFLWWGMKFVEGGRAIETYLPDVEPHLKSLYLARVRRSIGREASMLVADAALNIAGNCFTGGALFVCDSLASARNLYEAYQLGKENRNQEDYKKDGISAAQEKKFSDADEKILSDFRCLFDEPSKKLVRALMDSITTFSPKDMNSVPMVLFLDQLEFLDSRSASFLKEFIAEAYEKAWPVLIIATCHSIEMGQRNKLIDELLSYPNGESVSHIEVEGISSGDMSGIWTAEFPGLTTQQIAELSSKVDGNPQMMRELIEWLRDETKWFENRDVNAPLTEKGVAKIRRIEFTLHDLVKKRIRKQGETIADVIGLSSYQGTQFVETFVKNLSKRILLDTDEETDAALQKAQNPLHITQKCDSSLAEFSHTTYYEVARGLLEDLEDSSPNFSSSAVDTLVEQMTQSDYPAESTRAAEILSLMTLEAIPAMDSPVSGDDCYRQFARVRALAFMTRILPYSEYADKYLEELPRLLDSVDGNPGIISNATFPLEHTLRPIFENFADDVEGRDKALACLKEIILSYLNEGEKQGLAVEVRLTLATLFFARSTKRAWSSSLFSQEDWDFLEDKTNSLNQKYGKEIEKYGREIDDVLLDVEQSKNMPAYLKQSLLAILFYGKDLIELDHEKSYKHKLVKACVACIHENAPEEILHKVMLLALYENSPHDGADFFEYICNHLESLREAGQLTAPLRYCYHMAICMLNYTVEGLDNLLEYNKKHLLLDVQGIKEEGYESVKNDGWFLPAVQSVTKENLLLSKSPNETLSEVVKLLEDLPSYLHQRKDFNALLEISETIITAMVLNTREGLTDPESYMRKISTKVLDALALTALREDPDINMNQFLERILLNILMIRLNTVATDESNAEEQVRLLKLLVDKAPQMKVDGVIENFEEWRRIEKTFEQYSIYNWQKPLRTKIADYIASKINEAETMPETVKQIRLLYSLKFSLKR